MTIVQSIREGYCKLFISYLHDIIPWMFALDHIHYALKAENRQIFESFASGYFTIRKSRKKFSKHAKSRRIS